MLKTRYIKRATVIYPEILDNVLETEITLPVRDVRHMYREIQGRAGAYRGYQGLTEAHRGCVQWLTGDYRVQREWVYEIIQGMTGKT